jgi:hypothetical protein
MAVQRIQKAVCQSRQNFLSNEGNRRHDPSPPASRLNCRDRFARFDADRLDFGRLNSGRYGGFRRLGFSNRSLRAGIRARIAENAGVKVNHGLTLNHGNRSHRANLQALPAAHTLCHINLHHFQFLLIVLP